MNDSRADIEYLRLGPDDWEAYRNLRLEALKREPASFCTTYVATVTKPEEVWRSRLEVAATDAGNWLMFARQEGKLIGMAGASLEEDGSTVSLNAVYVTAGSRGQGVSKALLSALMEVIKGNHAVRTVSLVVNRDQHAAVALYRSLGFEVTQTEVGVMGDGASHAQLVMQKPL